MILSIYKELLDELDLHDLANQFVSGSESRLRVFGTFWDSPVVDRLATL